MNCGVDSYKSLSALCRKWVRIWGKNGFGYENETSKLDKPVAIPVTYYRYIGIPIASKRIS